MKRTPLILIAAMLCLSCAQADQRYCSVSDLREQTPARWTQTYETKWRTIEVDAAIDLPDVQAVPVLQVGYDTLVPRLSAEQSSWDSVKSRGGMIILSNNDPKMPRKVDGKRINQTQEASGQWYSGFTPQSTYVPMSDIPFGNITAMINDELAQFGYDPAAFRVSSPLRLWALHWYFLGKKEDALQGTVLL